MCHIVWFEASGHSYDLGLGSVNSLGSGYAHDDYEQKSLLYLFKKKSLYSGCVMPECS